MKNQLIITSIALLLTCVLGGGAYAQDATFNAGSGSASLGGSGTSP